MHIRVPPWRFASFHRVNFVDPLLARAISPSSCNEDARNWLPAICDHASANWRRHPATTHASGQHYELAVSRGHDGDLFTTTHTATTHAKRPGGDVSRSWREENWRRRSRKRMAQARRFGGDEGMTRENTKSYGEKSETWQNAKRLEITPFGTLQIHLGLYKFPQIQN